MPTSTPKEDLPKREQFAKLENNYIIQRQADVAYCAHMRKNAAVEGKQTFNDHGTLFKRKPKDLTQR